MRTSNYRWRMMHVHHMIHLCPADVVRYRKSPELSFKLIFRFDSVICSCCAWVGWIRNRSLPNVCLTRTCRPILFVIRVSAKLQRALMLVNCWLDSRIKSWLGLGEPSKGGAARHTSKPGLTACASAWPRTNSSIPKTLQHKE